MPLRQRYKIYKAEALTWPYCGSTTPEAAQGWFDWVARTKWWRKHSDVRHFRIKYPVFGKMSGIVMEDGVAVIEYGPFSLIQPSFIHDLGHVLDYHPGASREQMEKDHGKKFAGILLALTKRYISAGDAEALEKNFKECGVQWTEY